MTDGTNATPNPCYDTLYSVWIFLNIIINFNMYNSLVTFSWDFLFKSTIKLFVIYSKKERSISNCSVLLRPRDGNHTETLLELVNNLSSYIVVKPAFLVRFSILDCKLFKQRFFRFWRVGVKQLYIIAPQWHSVYMWHDVVWLIFLVNFPIHLNLAGVIYD